MDRRQSRCSQLLLLPRRRHLSFFASTIPARPHCSSRISFPHPESRNRTTSSKARQTILEIHLATRQRHSKTLSHYQTRWRRPFRPSSRIPTIPRLSCTLLALIEYVKTSITNTTMTSAASSSSLHRTRQVSH